MHDPALQLERHANGVVTAAASRRRLDDEDGDGYTNDEDDVDDDEEFPTYEEEEADGYAADGSPEGSNEYQNVIDEANPEIHRDPDLLKCAQTVCSPHLTLHSSSSSESRAQRVVVLI